MGALPASAAALLAAAALLLSGCGDDTPPPTPSSSSVPTTASPTTQSPTPQPESAEEFIRRWVQADIDMQNSGETGDYRQLSADCQPCIGFADTIEGYYAAGGFVETKGWLITSIKKAPGGSTRRPIYVVAVNSRPTRYKETKTGPSKTLPGERTRYRVSIHRVESSWLVSDLIEVAS